MGDTDRALASLLLSGRTRLFWAFQDLRYLQGAPIVVEKVIFQWDGSLKLPPYSGRLTFRSLTTDDDPEFARLVEHSFAATLDRLARHSLTTATRTGRMSR